VPHFRLFGEMKEMKQNCRVVSKWSLEKEIGLKKKIYFGHQHHPFLPTGFVNQQSNRKN